MKPAREIAYYRRLIISGLALAVITIAGFVIGMDLQKSCRTLLVMNTNISRIQTDASFHLMNYARTGDVRDLQKFRSTASPLIDLARAMNEVESEESNNESITNAFVQVGLTNGQATRINRLSNYSRVIPFPDRDITSWDYAMTYHYRLFDLSRRLLRDHVHGNMTGLHATGYMRELQELNQQIMLENEIMEAGLVRYIERIGRVTSILIGITLLVGFGFIGYVAFHVEKCWIRHERFLYKSRDRYRDMFEQAGIGILQLTTEGQILRANESIVHILGYDSSDELKEEITNFFRKFVDPERKEEFKTLLEENESVSNFMFRVSQKSEKQIWILCNARSVKDESGTVLYYEASMQDYTLYRQTNQELHYLTGILRGMAASIYQLLRTPDFNDAIKKMMKTIGQAGAFDRVHIYRSYGGGESRTFDLKYEWVKYDTLHILNTKATRNMNWDEWMPETVQELEGGRVLDIMPADHEGAMQKWMKQNKSRVLLAAPIIVDKRLWGVLCFDNCSNADPWPDESKQVIRSLSGALGYYIQKVRMQESLVESKNLHQALLANIREVVFQADQQGNLCYVSPAWDQITHCDSSDCIGKSIYEFMHPDDREKAREDFEQLLESGQKNFRREYRLKCRGGQDRWLEWNVMLLDQSREGTPQFYGTMYDLTERKASEEAMLQNNQRLEALIESSPMMMSVVGTDGYVTLWNRSAETTYGWKRDEVLGQPAPDVPDDQQDDYMEMLDRVLSGEVVRGLELERRRRDGSRLYVQMFASPLYGSNGKVDQVITFAQDVSEAKISREAIRKSLKEKNVLLSEIHHRVKNNMAVISGLLSLKAQEQKDPAIAELLRENENRIRSMSMIHEKLYQTDTYAEIEFGGYLRDLAEHINNQYEDLDVSTEIEAEDVYLEISQAVPCGLLANEIVTNCYKHAFPENRAGKVKITLADKAGKCELIIRDDGVGLPEELLAGRPDQSFGLNLIRGLSKQVKGELEMRNENGLFVKVVFPLV
ncbi:PAS domain S-box protein [Balneolales bacterium ANBcel1]|nr:PAS domain S-box protein [Balneolales bacterium ANBcel1]